MRRQGISAANPARTRRIRPAAPKRRPTAARLCRVATAATLLLLAPVTTHAAPQDDPTIPIAPGDPAMQAAIAEAQRGLPVFFGHVTAPGPGETGFLVKYDLVPEDRAEFIWAEIISHRGDITVARLANPPRDPRFKKGDQVTIRNGQIIDWAYFRDGTLQGGATMRVLISRMAPQDARAMLDRLGW